MSILHQFLQIINFLLLICNLVGIIKIRNQTNERERKFQYLMEKLESLSDDRYEKNKNIDGLYSVRPNKRTRNNRYN